MWEENLRETIRGIFDWIANTCNINRFDVPVFIIIISVLLLLQVIGIKMNKPAINTISAILGLVMLAYFGVF